MVTSTLNTASSPIATAQPGALRRAANAVWRALEAVGQQRAHAHLISLGSTHAEAVRHLRDGKI